MRINGERKSVDFDEVYRMEVQWVMTGQDFSTSG
jgi:hypothetical protein